MYAGISKIMLYFILIGLHGVSNWVPLENGIEVELELSRSTSAASGDGSRRPDGHNFLSSLKRTFSSKHKAT